MPISSFSSANSIMKPGVCTSTTRPASPYDGQVVYETDTDRVAVYDSSAWVYKTNAVAPALALVKSQTIGSAVSSVTVSDVFSATYDAYKIVITGGVGSTANTSLYMVLGATTTSYEYGGFYGQTGSFGGLGSTAATSFYVGESDTNSLQMNMDIMNPFLSKYTHISGNIAYNLTNQNSRGGLTGTLKTTTSYTAFTLSPASGTITGGTIRVYGYSN